MGEDEYKGELVNYFSGIDSIRIKKTKIKFLMGNIWLTFHYNTIKRFEMVKITDNWICNQDINYPVE